MDHRVLSSPHLAGIGREASWPVESFGDLRLSGSEPKIFPGLVSRTQRKDSLNVRKGSGSEGDYDFYGGSGKGESSGGSAGGGMAMGHTRKGRSASSLRAVGVVDAEEEEDVVEEEEEVQSDAGSN